MENKYQRNFLVLSVFVAILVVGYSWHQYNRRATGPLLEIGASTARAEDVQDSPRTVPSRPAKMSMLATPALALEGDRSRELSRARQRLDQLNRQLAQVRDLPRPLEAGSGLNAEGLSRRTREVQAQINLTERRLRELDREGEITSRQIQIDAGTSRADLQAQLDAKRLQLGQLQTAAVQARKTLPPPVVSPLGTLVYPSPTPSGNSAGAASAMPTPIPLGDLEAQIAQLRNDEAELQAQLNALDAGAATAKLQSEQAQQLQAADLQSQREDLHEEMNQLRAELQYWETNGASREDVRQQRLVQLQEMVDQAQARVNQLEFPQPDNNL